MKRLLPAAALAPAGLAAVASRTTTPVRSTPRVRKDATPSREPVELALATSRRCSTAPATSTARATAAACWSTSRAGSGPRRSAPAATTPRSPSTTRSRSLTSSSSARPTSSRSSTTPASCSAARGFRILAERLGEVDSPALGADRARGGAALLAGRRPASPTPSDRDRDLFELMIELERELGFHVPSFSADDLRLQGDGRAAGARRVLPGPTRRALRDRRLLRPQPLLDQHLALVQARAAVLGPRPQRRDQHDRAAAPGGADARRRDPGRRLGLPGPEPHDRHLVRVDGLSLAEAMEMVVPPVVNEIRSLPAELHPFYMYLRQAMGPFAQGPVALIARHDDECVFSADALGLRPLWKVETADDFVFSSEPGVVSVHEMVSEPLPLGPGREVDGHDRPREARARGCGSTPRCSARSPAAGSSAPARRRWRRYDRALRDRRPARGRRDPRLHGGRPGRAGQGVRERARRLRLAARRRQALPADGVERRRADRLARLRRPAGGALARSARTSPTTSRRRSRWSPTRRSTASARWSTSRPAPSSAAGRRCTTRPPTPARSRRRSR